MKGKLGVLLEALGIILLLMGCVSYNVMDDESLKNRLKNDFLSYQQNNHFSGSVLVVRNGKTILNEAYGLADYDKKIPNTPDTKFRIASVSKQFTAMCIMMLQEKGLLNVYDKISKYLPDYPNGNKITIYDLLTHTSGMAEYTSEDFLQHADKHYSPAEIVSLFKNEPLLFPPGKEFRYTDSNYVLLGIIIEKVSHTTYENFLDENILRPLDMKNTGCDHNEMTDDTAIGYKYEKSKFVKANYIDMSAAYATGGLYSTVNDLYKWDQALYTEKLINAESMNEYFSPNKFNYAYGWVIFDKEQKNPMYHGGGVNGFESFIFRDTNLKEFAVVLCNNESFDLKYYHKILKTITGKNYEFSP